MTATKKHRRVRWRVRRCPDGWLPVVLIGEERITLGCEPDKHKARDAARARAENVRAASATYK